MKYDSYRYHYSSRRNLVFAKKGMVGSSNPLAAQAGLEVLKKGGNAIDAIVATAACLTVVEPSANGIGGDAFAIVHTSGKMYGINGSGPAPQLISADKLRERGYETIPLHGLDPVSVPGAPATWAALAQRFGRLPLTETLAPAIRHAEEGFAIAPTVARLLMRYDKIYRKALEKYPVTQTWFDTFAPGGRVPKLGEAWGSPGHAKTLRLIAQTNAEAFYKGEVAETIDVFSKKYNGYLRADDLAAFAPEWVEPLSANYRGYDVWQLPPNCQGIVVLEALNILKQFDLTHKEDILTYHRQIEAVKLAFVDGMKYIADPRFVKVPTETLISNAYAQQRHALLSDAAVVDPAPGEAPGGGTVYLAAVDDEGNMVSYIQSNYTGFGAGAVVPGYGVSLHNRGSQFSLKAGHANELAPGKRPYHTIMPGFLTKNGQPLGPFGVMGGPLQPQAHLQVVSSMADFHLNPQDALDAPRWQWLRGKTVEVEPDFPNNVALGLQHLGHEIAYAPESIMYGRGQIILRNEHGVYVGGTEPRADGTLAIW